MACVCLFCTGFASARTERLTIQGDHGKLVADLQTPDVMPKRCPIVILCHGFGGARNNGLFNGIADGLEKLGIATIRFDFNGHGESEGDFQQMTVPNEVEALYTNGPAGGCGAVKRTRDIVSVASILINRNDVKPEIAVYTV